MPAGHRHSTHFPNMSKTETETATGEGAEGCAPVQPDRRWSELKHKAAA